MRNLSPKKSSPVPADKPLDLAPSEAISTSELLGVGAAPKATKKPLLVTDYVSGAAVRAGPEEVEAVQVFSRRLVEELGYPKSHIRTHPQFSVRSSPSGKAGKASSYPIDIAIFSSDKQLESDLSMIVECKRKSRKEGEEQLKIYMAMSPSTQVGVWFNGSDHLYLLREFDNGQVRWSYLPTLPKFGQSVADIGSLHRQDLVRPTNLKAVFRDIRNHLAGNTTGITRDQELAIEIISILFCKIYDEINTAPDALPRFRTAHRETPKAMKDRLNQLFKDVQREYPDVFRANELITLDTDSLRYVVGELQNYCVIDASRDAIGDAFEVFIGPAVRGEEGQFFTPRNVVEMMVKIVDPRPGETIIDPACGSGGFLTVALEHVWRILEAQAPNMNWSPAILEGKKRDTASRCFNGLDKDAFLTKVTKAYMAVIGDGRGGIFCEDSLAAPDTWKPDAQNRVRLGAYDIVITNPPFGSKIKVTGEKKLGQYELGKSWKETPKDSGNWVAHGGYRSEQSPQVLFIERCIQLLKPNGRMAIVLPESIFGMPLYGYVVTYLFDNFSLRGFVSLPEEVFQPYTHAKTCVLFLQKRKPGETSGDQDEAIEMAIADWCGHDSRGNPTIRTTPTGSELLDDIPLIGDQMSAKRIWA